MFSDDFYFRMYLIQQESLLEDGWPYPDDDLDIQTTDETLERILARDQIGTNKNHKNIDQAVHYRRAHYKGNFDL